MTNAYLHINHKIYRPVLSVNITKVVTCMYFRWVVFVCTLLNIKQIMKSCSLSTVSI